MYDIALFDLDGTISESHEGIKASLEYALTKLGTKIPDLTDYSKYIGPPLIQTFESLCGLTSEDAKKAYEYYAEYYDTKGVYNNTIYPGIKNLAEELTAAGIKIVVCTSKFEAFAYDVIKLLDLQDLFKVICGSTKRGSRQDKEEIIPRAIKAANAKPTDKIVMIGDTKFDAKGARICSVDFIGVLYGYGTLESMKEESATVFAETVEDLKNLLLQL